MRISPAPLTQHLPMPRATTAAWDVMPPRIVRMPWATAIPRRSSGEVSIRTRTTFFLRSAQLSASSAENTIWPVAAPGDAGRPLAATVARLRADLSNTGWRSSSSFWDSMRRRAVFSSISPARRKSMAILTMAAPVRLPLRVWSIQSLPS